MKSGFRDSRVMRVSRGDQPPARQPGSRLLHGFVDPAITALLTVALPESNTLTGARLHANAGWRGHGDTRGAGSRAGRLYFLEPVHPAVDRDRLDLRLALELSGQRTTLFAELLLDQLLNDDLRVPGVALFLTPGLRYSFSESFSLLACSKIALATDDEGTTRLKAPETSTRPGRRGWR